MLSQPDIPEVGHYVLSILHFTVGSTNSLCLMGTGLIMSFGFGVRVILLKLFGKFSLLLYFLKEFV